MTKPSDITAMLPAETCAVVSTKHITFEDSIKLNLAEEQRQLVVFSKGDYGWFVHVPSEPDVMQMHMLQACDFGFSPAFLDIFKRAHDQGCDFLCLDRDGEVIEGLQAFDW